MTEEEEVYNSGCGVLCRKGGRPGTSKGVATSGVQMGLLSTLVNTGKLDNGCDNDYERCRSVSG